MKQRINVAEVCKAYNSVRDKNKGRKFPAGDIIKLLKEVGVSDNLAKRMRASQKLFPSYQLEGHGKGKHIAYLFPYESVHVSWFTNWLYGKKEEPRKKEEKRDLSFEEECCQYLKKLGYKIYKPNGYNMTRLAEENPELLSKYKTYKEL